MAREERIAEKRKKEEMTLRVSDPVPAHGGGILFMLAEGGGGGNDDDALLTAASAKEEKGGLDRRVWRAMRLRAPEWFEEHLDTDEAMGAYFPVSAAAAAAGRKDHVRLRGLRFIDGAFLWDFFDEDEGGGEGDDEETTTTLPPPLVLSPVSDAYYLQYVAAVNAAREVRMAASKAFLARNGIFGAEHIAAGAETP